MNRLTQFFQSIFGSFTWQKPSWVTALFRKLRQHLKVVLCTLAGFGVLLLSISGIAYYIHHLPKPHTTQVEVTVPIITPEKKVVAPQALAVTFNRSEDKADSVAPLKKIGKVVTSDIAINPAIPGSWKWENDHQLTFMPTVAWPAGNDYTITFSKGLFAKKIHLEKWQVNFTTIRFEPTIKNFEFYLDLKNPKSHKVVGTIDFNYPVKAETLSKYMSLTAEKDKVNYTLNIAKDKWQAYFSYELPALPDNPYYMHLLLDKGIQPENGMATTTPVKAQITIPDKSHVLRVQNVNANIIRNQKDEPEQVITVETSIGVDTTTLARAIRVYVLPKDYPATKLEEAKEDYEWSNPGEVKPEMLTTPVKLEAIPTEHEFDTMHGFKLRAPHDSYLYIEVSKNLVGYGDYNLAQSYLSIVQAPSFPKEIRFLHKGALLALSSEKKLSLVTRDMPAIKYTIARVLPDNINHLITQTGGDFQNPIFRSDDFDATNISKIAEEIQPLNDSDPAKAQYTTLDLAKYFDDNKNIKLGLFLLQAQGWDVTKKENIGEEARRLVLITDMGLIVKNNQDGSHDVFVQSISQGTPLANAEVMILGKNGLPLFTRTTDAEGHAVFPTLKDFVAQNEPTVYVARLHDDVSFMPYAREDRKLNYSRFDTDGLTSTNQYGINAYLFSDRGIYRPGDLVHLGLIIKNNFALAAQSGLPMELIVTDPRGNTVLDKKIISDGSGLMNEEYKTNYTGATGHYSAELYITKDNQRESLLGHVSFNVQEFLPDTLKIAMQFEPKPAVAQGWITPDKITANIQLLNLFGTPASDRRITGTLYFVPQSFYFDNYSDYTFIDPLLDPKKPPKVFSESLPDTKTDNKGDAHFNLDLKRYDAASYKLTLETQGFAADGGRGVTMQKSIMVSPRPFLIGFKSDGDLDYVKQNDKRSIHFIAIDPNLKSIPQNNLTVKIIKLNSITTLTKQDDDTYRYIAVTQEAPISTNSLTLTPEGKAVTLPTADIGDYKIQITDQTGLVLSQTAFSVVGASQGAVEKTAELSVKLNKTTYVPGENIELQINAPYAGAGLITLERDKTYAFKWFKTSNTSTMQTITVPKDFVGSGYVNVTFVRDFGSDEIFMNPMSFSVQPFTVIPTTSIDKIDLTAVDKIRPGQPLNIQYKTDQPGKIIVYAVDEGILQVAAYKTPDPLHFFFQKVALGVETSQIVDQILPKYIASRELSAIGGDGEDAAALNKNLNPFKRKTDAPVVFWSGVVDSDATSRTLQYTVPDYFNGTLRLMAVAVANNAVGAIDKKVTVQDYFVLTPNAPTFVAPNDEFTVSVSVANNNKDSTSPATVNLQLQTSPQLTVVGESKQVLQIAPEAEKSVTYTIKAKKSLGAATLTFTATAGDKSVRREISLSVRPASTYQTTLITGYSKANKTITVPRQLYSNDRVLTATASTNPLVLVNGLNDYMKTYPYVCSEQLLSRAFVQLAMTMQPGFQDQAAFDAEFQNVLQLLRQRQMSDGGVAYWPGAGDNPFNTFSSIYAADFLTTAAANGQTIPKDLFSRIINNLKDYAASDAASLDDARLHAYAIYVLTRNEIVTTNYITNLQTYLETNEEASWKKDIVSVYLAASYHLLQNKSEANKLIAGYTLSNDKDSTDYYGVFFSPRINDAQYISILAQYFPDRLKRLHQDAILSLVQALSNQSVDSITAAFSAMALSRDAAAINATSQDQNLAIAAIDAAKKVQKLQSSNAAYPFVNFDDNAKALQFTTSAEAPYYYQMTQTGFDNTLPTNIIKDGLEIYREYQNKDNNTVTETTLGSELTVHVKLRALGNKDVSNVAIIDLLPGGFEVVPNSVQNNDALAYYDVREDRIVFYASASTNVTDLVYKIRAVNKGNYVIPPAYAVDMYHMDTQARDVGGNMKVV